MCGCPRHHHHSEMECTCLCPHPGDTLTVRVRKTVRRKTYWPLDRMSQWPEKATLWVAWKCPRTLAYWITVRVAVENSPDYPAEQPVGEVLEKWRTHRQNT